ncbi:MAG: HNH endonuclease [Vulcanimicrobiota bacterium]
MIQCMNNIELDMDDTASHADGLDLKQGLSSEEVHKRALLARKLYGKAQKALTFWIVEMDERKLYKDFSCSNIFQYAARYLSLGEHTIAELLRTGKALAQLPLLSQAYEKGEISSTHIREITRVATPETESFWCEAAKKSTTRQIEKLVAFSPKGDLPPVQIQLPVKATQLPVKATQLPVKATQLPAQAPNHSQAPLPSQIPFPTAPGSKALPAVPGDKPLPGDTALSPAGLTSCATSSGQESQNGNGEIHLAKADKRNQQEEKKENAITEATGSVTAPIKYHDKLIVELSGEEMSIVKDALNKARKESGLRDRKSLLLFIVKSFLADTHTDGKENRKPPYQILLHHHLPSGLTWSDTMKGEMPVSHNVLEKALCDAEIIEVDEPDCPLHDLVERPARDLHKREEKAEGCCRDCSSREPSGSSKDGLSRVNKLYKIYKERNRKSENGDKSSDGNDNAHGGSRRGSAQTEKTISDAMRKKVLKRDGHKCQAPGCGRTYFLEVHHIKPEGAGGATEEKNLCTSCAFCHDLVHEGKLSVEGEAPHKLTWRDGKGRLI